jgi:hypothetical protein
MAMERRGEVDLGSHRPAPYLRCSAVVAPVEEDLDSLAVDAVEHLVRVALTAERGDAEDVVGHGDLDLRYDERAGVHLAGTCGGAAGSRGHLPGWSRRSCAPAPVPVPAQRRSSARVMVRGVEARPGNGEEAGTERLRESSGCD